MNYKAFIIGDLHLKNQDPLGVITKEGFNSRLLDKLNSLKFVIEQALKEEATHIVLEGDIFHGVTPDEKVRKLFWQAMAPAVKAGIQIRIIRGNHDLHGETANLDGESFIIRDSVKILEPILFKEKIGEITVGYIPYKDSTEIIRKWIEDCSDCDVIYGHIEVDGATLGVDNYAMRHPISKDLFKNPQFVILGHIHKFQPFYIGSTTYCDFSERGDQKCYAVVTATGKTLQKQYFSIPQRPMIQVEVNEEDVGNIYNLKEIPETIDIPDALIKVVFKGTSAWIRTINFVKFKKRFKRALKVVKDTEKTDSVLPVKVEAGISLMEDRTKAYNEVKNKGPEYLTVGLELAFLSQKD